MTVLLKMHDFSIVGITHNKINNELIFNIDDNSNIIFCDVFYWNLTPFDMQNIIFEISSYREIPSFIIDEYELKKGIPNNFNLYHINSISGLSGIVISKKIKTLKEKQHKTIRKTNYLLEK